MGNKSLTGKRGSSAKKSSLKGLEEAPTIPISVDETAPALPDNKVQWKLWNTMDLRSEKEMMELASFLSSLKENVADDPAMKKKAIKGKYKEKAAKHGQYVMMLALGAGDISMKDLTFEDLYDGLHMPEGKLTSEWVISLMNSFRDGKKLLSKYAYSLVLDSIEYFKSVNNVDYVDIPEGVSVTIIGDTHGQLYDLMYIFDTNGLPSETNWYIINGDLVDRGTQAVEIILLLLAWKSVYPRGVLINRGNHEELTICTVYGFKNEVIDKYDSQLFEYFLELFSYLPLATIVQKKIIVLHGGLPCTDHVKISDIDALPRNLYPGGVNEMSIEEMQNNFSAYSDFPDDERKLCIDIQMIRDVLWSDPSPENGREESDRSAGCKFGPDVCRSFLKENGLSLIVRSHEAVPEGFAWPYGSGKMLITIFSATNYGGVRSAGAYMKLDKNLTPRITTYSAHVNMRENKREESVTEDVETNSTLSEANHKNMVQIIITHREELRKAFIANDTAGTNMVTKSDWSEIMELVSGLRIAWSTLQPFVADADESGNINYNSFLNRYVVTIDKKASSKRLLRRGSSKKGTVPSLPSNEDGVSVNNLDKLYGNKDQLLCIFRFFDTDSSGTIDRAEFDKGMQVLRKKRPMTVLPDADNLWAMLDIDGSNEIDVNEFLEAFRVVDTMFVV